MMVAWSERCVLLALAVSATPTLGYHHTRRNPTAGWVSHQLRQEHRQHVVGIRGGATSGAGSLGEGLGGFGTDVGSSLDSAHPSSKAAGHPSDRVLVLDVDGTLYGQSSGVEQQIVDGIHRYFEEELGLTPAECNQIHQRHGSTIWGLQQEGRLTDDQVERYYKQVFASVSVRNLQRADGGDATGYQHRADVALMILRHRGPVFVASNSPLPHVRRVLESVGLGEASFAGFLTPDTRGWVTKSSPEFYDPILKHSSVSERGMREEDIWLLDDSAVNLEVAARLGFSTLLVNNDGGGASEGALPAERALACFVGAIPHPEEWKFSDSKYLRSKNAVDRASRSAQVWARLEEEVLALRLEAHDTLRVADVGCGLLPLLAEFRSLAEACGVRRLEYCGIEKEGGVAKDACEDLVKEGYTLDEGGGSCEDTSSGGDGWPPLWKLSICRDEESGLPDTTVRVIAADFTSVDPAALFPIPCDAINHHPDDEDAAHTAAESEASQPPHVLVGCCLADLLAPAALMRALERLAGVGRVGDGAARGCLVYLPITFVGKTSMIPPAPQEGLIPSDEAVLGAYDACLRDRQGHCTCLGTLLQTIREHGGDAMVSSPSPWRVSAIGDDRYMWECLLYFVGLGLAPYPLYLAMPAPAPATEPSPAGLPTHPHAASSSSGSAAADAGSLGGEGAEMPEGSPLPPTRADYPGWVRRARERAPVLQADNVDLLFRMRGGGKGVEGARGGGRRGGGGKGRGGWVRAGARGDGGGGGGVDGGLGGMLQERGSRAAARRETRRGSMTMDGGVAALAASSRGGGAGGTSPKGDGNGVSPPEAGTAAAAAAPAVRDNAFLEFVAPGKVEVRHEELGEEGLVGEGQVLVEAICSSISSGTELKVFRGDFDSESELDTTIKGMAGESMSYPLRYGYSMVGRVAKCGAGVEQEKFLGKLVFTFSPHSSWVVADSDGVMLVPEGIEPEDAVYLPAVETALSLVHDVHPRVGETVAVFGQGMIGLLAVSILARTHQGVGGGSVIAVDMLPERLEVAKRLGVKAAVSPVHAAELAPFDISLEVTGNPRGLQSALDLTGYGGRVVLGSWYGGGAAQLNLGMAFHRSHLTIQTSQVSRLPAGLTDRWDKARRFAAAWSLVRELRPSRFLTTSSPGLEGAQGAYESLGAGSELGVVFRY